MAYDFNSAFSSSGIQVTTLTTTFPAWSKNDPAKSQNLSATTTPSWSSAPVATTALAETGVHRRDYDHYGDFNFIVEIDGLSAGAFQSCDGLSFEVDLIEYQDGMDPYPRKRRGTVKWGNIKLTKGYTTNTALWDWCAEILQGGMGRRTGAIHLLGDDVSAGPIKTFKWINGFPVKWNGFKFDSSAGKALVEDIEFAVEEVMVG
jgi:phage tail-like protein